MDKDELDYEKFITSFCGERDRIFGYIRALLPNQADAEDVFQRTSLVLWKKFADYDQSMPFLPWACSVAHFEVRNFARIASRDRLQFDETLMQQIADDRLNKSVDKDSRINALQDCLKSLKPQEKEVIDLVYRKGISIRAIADEKSIPCQTLYNQVSIARRKLHDCVQRKMTLRSQTS